MKLRIRGDSIRFRLTRGEVERLRSTGSVEESLSLGINGKRFTYALNSSGECTRLTADLNDGVLRVMIPAGVAGEWAQTDNVGIESPIGSVPRILIEKDFACLSERAGEDESDMFPNPDGAACGADGG